MSKESFPTITGKQTFISICKCMVCGKTFAENDLNQIVSHIFEPPILIIYCENTPCKRAAEYNKLRLLCLNNCIDMNLFEEIETASVPRTDGSITENCLISILRPVQMSQSRNCLGVWVSIPKVGSKLCTLRELFKTNENLREKFKNGIQYSFQDNEFWSRPEFEAFRKKIEQNIQELNEEFFS